MKPYTYDPNAFHIDRIIYTPSQFAKSSLLFLQETGELHALKPYISNRENLSSYLFFIVLNGNGYLEYEGVTYHLTTGDCVFIDCSTKYILQSSEQLWTLRWVHFNGYNASQLYEFYRRHHNSPTFSSPNFSFYDTLLKKIYQLASEVSSVQDIDLYHHLNTLITTIIKESRNLSHQFHVKRNQNTLLYEIKQYLEEHFMQNISLDDLANTFYINKFHLSRLFKEEFDESIHNYMIKKRITHAKELLRFSDLSIEDISQQCGIEDANYFSRNFKRIEGISPSSFRKKWKM